MAHSIELTVENRTILGKSVKKLRRQGILPGVIYGYRLDKPQPIQVDGRTFDRIYHRAGNIHLVNLQVGETGTVYPVMVHEVKRDPITHNLSHVDFVAVNLRVEITTHVQIVLAGVAPAVAAGDGMLLQTLETISIKVLPASVPETITVDVSGLSEVGAAVHVKDLVVPEGVTVLTDPEETVALITAIRVEAVEEAEATTAAEAETAGGDEDAGESGS